MSKDTQRIARTPRRYRARATAAICAALLLAASASSQTDGARAERASQPSSAAAGGLDAGGRQTCALLASASMRCWGYSGAGELGYGNTSTVGDDETPGSVAPVDLGPRTVVSIGAGDFHSCALLDDGTVRCWGFGDNGRLGYGDTMVGVPPNVGDDETPGSRPPVDLDPDPASVGTATAISAGGSHTCAVLDNGTVRCWGYGFNGQLGYGDNVANRQNNVGDNETPGSRPPVDLDPDPASVGTAKAISAGARHTCALLDNGTVRCWGLGANGELGYGNTADRELRRLPPESIGDDEAPGSVGPVDLGGHTAVAISAGDFHTCAVLDDGSVRCWGYAADGALGYGNTDNVGDNVNETPGSRPPVDLDPDPAGVGTAKAISAGAGHTCALLDNGTVRCWGYGGNGQLGYGSTVNLGDDVNETPDKFGPVNLGTGRTATAISAGGRHTCARLNDGNVRCWGFAANGRLGYCSPSNIGDDELPGSAGPVALETPGPPCPVPDAGGSGTGGGQVGAPAPPGVPATPDVPNRGSVDPLTIQALRARAYRTCLAAAKRASRRKRDSARRACLKRYGRTPGQVAGLRARVTSTTKIVLSFTAPGTDGARPPAARAYLVKQSTQPIRSARDLARAQTLCKGSCRFKVTRVGTKINLTITGLRPKTTYYYAIAARDNVSERLGPRSRAVKTKTR